MTFQEDFLQDSVLPGGPVAPERLTNLLRLGMIGTRKTYHRLLDRLAMEDGAAWFDGIASSAIRNFGIEREGDELRPAPTSLEEMKRSGKRAVARDRSEPELLRGLIEYFLALSIEASHNGRWMTSRDPSELAPIMLDLAASVSPPWSAIFERAGFLAGGNPDEPA
ncbi:MAG: hypothetical protein AAGD00_06745 [Planctomycetota bacterium]